MLILKGFIIGLGKIIPGVSGSMLAISMGIYQKIIDSINNFFKDIKINFKFLFKIGIGVLMAITLFSKIILWFLNKYYIVTMFFFIGLIIGSFKNIKKEITSINKKAILITVILVLLLGFININNEINLGSPIFNFLYFLLVGFIDAFTMVVPGISGTATLMMIGAYDKLMNIFANIFNFSFVSDNFLIILPYALGLLLGVLLTVKLINYLFKNFKDITYSSIIGFSVSAMILMLIRCFETQYTLLNLIVAFIMFFIGLNLSKKINHYKVND